MPRDSNGNYTLPSSVNPVVAGTTITANWGNTTLNDVAQSVTDSLDRFGRGGMQAAFRSLDGTVSAPGLTFNNETTLGFYRSASGTLALAIGGALRLSVNSSGVLNVPGSITAGAISGPLTGNASTATALQTARLINGVSFNGTADITVADATKLPLAGGTLTGLLTGTTAVFNNNLGLGTPVGSWAAAADVMEMTFPAMGMDGAGQAFVAFNAREATPGAWVYKSTDTAQLFRSNAGGWVWSTAASGAVGGAITFTERMRIDANGNVLVATAQNAATQIAAANASVGSAGVGQLVSANSVTNTILATYSTGHATRPSQSWLFTDAAAPLIIGTNNTERMRIDSSGNVGIGLNNPGARLEINGNINTNAAARLGYLAQNDVATIAGVSTASYGLTLGATFTGFGNPGTMVSGFGGILFATAGLERVRIDNNGNVGIGNPPAAKLYLTGLGSATAPTNISDISSAALRIDTSRGSTAFGGITYSDGGGGGAAVVLGRGTSFDTNISFYTNPSTTAVSGAMSERMRIDAAGNVGIGRVPSGSAIVDVQSAGTGIIRVRGGTGTNQGSAVYGTVGSDTTTWAVGARACIYGGTPGNDSAVYSIGTLSLGTAGVERMLIDGSGNVGIGYSASLPTAASGGTASAGLFAARSQLVAHQTSMGVLQFSSASNLTQIRSYGATSGTGAIAFQVGGGGGSADFEAARIDAAGNVGIGVTPSPWGTAYRGHIQGVGWSLSTPLDGGSDTLALAANAYNSTGGTWIYRANAPAGMYQVFSGEHRWSTASSGTAGNAITFTERARIDSAGVFSYSATGGSAEVGFRPIPRSTTSGTAALSDRGRCIAVTAGITIPNATFAAGDSFSIYNDSAANITITQGASLTLRLAGTTSTGNRTLAPRGICTVWFNGASEAIISGGGLS